MVGEFHYTRCSTLLSMNRFRRRNGGGECVRRCSRKLFRDEANQGTSSGSTVTVHRGGLTPSSNNCQYNVLTHGKHSFDSARHCAVAGIGGRIPCRTAAGFSLGSEKMRDFFAYTRK